ncbi:MAG: acylphosphatase [bacterium]|nr:acylphosphatase [bacterium]
MKQYHIFVSGLVQGVGYRNFAQRKALELGLSGWVRNLADGRVEVMAIGKKDQLLKFINHLKRGPVLAKVDGLQIKQIRPIDISLLGSFKRLPTK